MKMLGGDRELKISEIAGNNGQIKFPVFLCKSFKLWRSGPLSFSADPSLVRHWEERMGFKMKNKKKTKTRPFSYLTYKHPSRLFPLSE